jgi:hypothetical protein
MLLHKENILSKFVSLKVQQLLEVEISFSAALSRNRDVVARQAVLRPPAKMMITAVPFPKQGISHV